jgi:hypothetical protein
MSVMCRRGLGGAVDTVRLLDLHMNVVLRQPVAPPTRFIRKTV